MNAISILISADGLSLAQSEIVPRKDVVMMKKLLIWNLHQNFNIFEWQKVIYVESAMRVGYIFNIFGINLWYILYFEYFRSKVESTFFFDFITIAISL